ncbi:hypothetical protein L228DRAFT_116921 [Xylona heveae TC161]|uniref:Transmembrane protein n=1 Tax=Xylona heveae (strain CBS 132557 / TC161) TaxID=1328760 RepID=A0A165HG97_XYLHT|nr:hypothetical protein L228DRAFT_116921 [Xylona heveae TC161]KZF23464.1 hypothetical protein L228DRAFT_116921 [Xylona heveae TC161]
MRSAKELFKHEWKKREGGYNLGNSTKLKERILVFTFRSSFLCSFIFLPRILRLFSVFAHFSPSRRRPKRVHDEKEVRKIYQFALRAFCSLSDLSPPFLCCCLLPLLRSCHLSFVFLLESKEKRSKSIGSLECFSLFLFPAYFSSLYLFARMEWFSSRSDLIPDANAQVICCGRLFECRCILRQTFNLLYFESHIRPDGKDLHESLERRI